ncbi:MAG TPA: fused MFS/spermidine synthase [Candidatus Sulfotelmatobacter sp.]|nr:fused MFS/spermidine synthase [Candidatus Sulfotelmatobacter sp.]
MQWYFAFFFLSGFCTILYELVWLRLAMAQFAVTTALVSILLSAFMVGLGCGSWAAGRYLRSHSANTKWPRLSFYALVELLIGVSAFAVPLELVQGRILLERIVATHPLFSAEYYVLAGLWIGITLIPWCACMGATFPFAMAAIQDTFARASSHSFSYLYLANVLGAMMGAGIPLLLIERWGFQHTLRLGATLNFSLALTAFILSRRLPRTPFAPSPRSHDAQPTASIRQSHYLLFGTGFTSMAVEIVWIRLFTPALGTVVYAFASILALYLGATYVGSWYYRRKKNAISTSSALLFGLLALSVVLPLLACDPRLPVIYPLRVLSILPFSFIVGWITPMILDDYAKGDPDRAGRGYAINVAGCVLGPLASGFVLIPLLGERYALLAFALPWIALGFRPLTASSRRVANRRAWQIGLVAAQLGIVFATKSFESQFSPREVRRDNTATVTAAGVQRDKVLLVNGVGMTALSPITKMIAHLPLAFMQRPPKDALVICFGMGTTHRSMLSWGVSSTAVELVPSVVSVFPFFHADAAQLLQSPRSHVVVDDGRFYLERSTDQYDVIVLDPPPPVEAAASSLLYSKEFYAIAKAHMRDGAILQQWFPQGSADPAILASATKAISQSFPYVRVFRSIEGWGYHFLGSNSPLPSYSAAELASHLPASASTDLLEWGPASNATDQFSRVLNQELSINTLIAKAPDVPALRDDRPVNEYFLLRRLQNPVYMQKLWQRFLAHTGRGSNPPS